jgi:hypothetical protein
MWRSSARDVGRKDKEKNKTVYKNLGCIDTLK